MSVVRKIFVIVSMCALLTAAFVFGGGIDNKVCAAPAKVLKVGTNIGFVPFEFKTDGEPQGFDIDLIKAVAEKMNYRVEIYDYDFDNLIDELNKKEVDVIIAAITVTDERKAQISFSDPYFSSGLAIVAAANSKINSIANLEGKTIFVEKGTTGADIAKTVKGANVLEFDSLSDKFSIIKHWNAAAIITDRPVIEYLLSSDKSIDGLKIVGKNLTHEEYGIGLRKADTKLQQEINAALKNLKNSGEYDKIYDKWFK